DGSLVGFQAGQAIKAGDILRSADTGAVLAMPDGSRLEVRAQSELALERADDGVRVRLNKGDLIVKAAKQRGHLYVQTRDVNVSVEGTVFLVNAEEKGSRVAVIEGIVQVQQGITAEKLLPGQQVTTNPSMPARPLPEEISWSRHVEEHLALLEQTAQAAPPRQNNEADRFEEVSI